LTRVKKKKHWSGSGENSPVLSTALLIRTRSEAIICAALRTWS